MSDHHARSERAHHHFHSGNVMQANPGYTERFFQFERCPYQGNLEDPHRPARAKKCVFATTMELVLLTATLANSDTAAFTAV